MQNAAECAGCGEWHRSRQAVARTGPGTHPASIHRSASDVIYWRPQRRSPPGACAAPRRRPAALAVRTGRQDRCAPAPAAAGAAGTARHAAPARPPHGNPRPGPRHTHGHPGLQHRRRGLVHRLLRDPAGPAQLRAPDVHGPGHPGHAPAVGHDARDAVAALRMEAAADPDTPKSTDSSANLPFRTPTSAPGGPNTVSSAPATAPSTTGTVWSAISRWIATPGAAPTAQDSASWC